MAVDIRLWLSAFHNQRRLAHQVSILISSMLTVVGIITFVTTGNSEFGNFHDFDGARHRTMLAWATGLVGAVSMSSNIAITQWHNNADRHDSRATDEQMEVRRTNAAVIGCVWLAALSVGLFIFFHALTKAGFVGPSIFVFLTAFMALITTYYDAASMLRSGRIELDEAQTVPLTVDEFDA